MLETRTEAIKNAGSANLDAQVHRFYRVTFDKANRQYFRQTLQQAFANGSWANTTEWVLDEQAKTLPYNISISNLVNANEGTASQAGPAAGYYYRPDGTIALDKTQDITVGEPPVTISVGVPENGYEEYSTVASKIQLLNAKGDKYQVAVYSATGLTDLQEGWQ